MGYSGPRSLFVVVLREYFTSPWFCSILQFKSNENNNHAQTKLPKKFSKKENFSRKDKGLTDQPTQQFKDPFKETPFKEKPFKETLSKHPAIKQSTIKQSPSSSWNHLLQNEYIAHFRLLQNPATIGWEFSLLTSTQELFMVPHMISDGYNRIKDGVPSLHGFTFNFGTKACRKILPAISSKPDRSVVNLGGYVYFMPEPCAFLDIPKPCFERYNPVKNLWETLQPFPLPRDGKESLRHIRGTAVLDDTILFNMSGPDIWAYNVTNNTWHPVTVKVEDKLCYSFVDEALVLENTIYALTDKSPTPKSILALSFVREEVSGGDFVYTCSLLSEISLPDINIIKLNDVAYRSRHLVPLGKDNFCLVQSCMRDGFPDFQPIQLTYMKLQGKNSLIVTDNEVHKLRIEGEQQFRVIFSFSLPDSKTPPAFKHGNVFLDIDPFRLGFDIKQIYSTDFNLETAEYVIPSVATPPLLIDQDNDEQEFEQGGPKSSGGHSEIIHLQEEGVPEKSSSSSVDECNALSIASTISSVVTGYPSHGSATHGDYPASPTFRTVGEALEYHTRGMSRGEARKAKRMLLDSYRKELCQNVASFLAKNSAFPEA